MKKTGRCPKCDHNYLLHVPEVADRVHVRDRGDTRAEPVVAAVLTSWRIARVTNPDAGFLDLPEVAVGLVEAWICRACGFTEMYTRDAGNIPIDGEHVREVVGPEGQGPYR